jgi:hypothetical protein
MPPNLGAESVDLGSMGASGYAFVQGIRSTREALEGWNRDPWRVLRTWLAGALDRPPFVTGDPGDLSLGP